VGFWFFSLDLFNHPNSNYIFAPRDLNNRFFNEATLREREGVPVMVG
jgi:hypothetical protein